jgi:hypothetical protein
MDRIGNIVPKNSSVVACVSIAAGTCLLSRCPAMSVYSGSATPAFRRHVKVLFTKMMTADDGGAYRYK